MGDMDYIPNPTVQIDSYQDQDEGASNKINNNEEVIKKPDGLSVKLPRSRGSESPTVTTPMVSIHVLIYHLTYLNLLIYHQSPIV